MSKKDKLKTDMRRVEDAATQACQWPYPMGSLLPPFGDPAARCPMVGAAVPQRASHAVDCLVGFDRRTGPGSLPRVARAQVKVWLQEAHLLHEPEREGDVGLQDCMRVMAELSALLVNADDNIAMRHLMRNDSSTPPSAELPVGACDERMSLATLRRIRTGGMGELWLRYALRVVAHALAAPMDLARLGLLRSSLRRAWRDILFQIPGHMAPAAALLSTESERLLTLWLGANASAVEKRWSAESPLFNPLRYCDSAEAEHVQLWLEYQTDNAKLEAEAQTRDQDTELFHRLQAWPPAFATQVQACAHALARELLDGNRVLDLGLTAPRFEARSLPKTDAPTQGVANIMHWLASGLRKPSGARNPAVRGLEALQNMHESQYVLGRREMHRTHFRFFADHPPGDPLRTDPPGRLMPPQT